MAPRGGCRRFNQRLQPCAGLFRLAVAQIDAGQFYTPVGVVVLGEAGFVNLDGFLAQRLAVVVVDQIGVGVIVVKLGKLEFGRIVIGQIAQIIFKLYVAGHEIALDFGQRGGGLHADGGIRIARGLQQHRCESRAEVTGDLGDGHLFLQDAAAGKNIAERLDAGRRFKIVEAEGDAFVQMVAFAVLMALEQAVDPFRR